MDTLSYTHIQFHGVETGGCVIPDCDHVVTVYIFHTTDANGIAAATELHQATTAAHVQYSISMAPLKSKFKPGGHHTGTTSQKHVRSALQAYSCTSGWIEFQRSNALAPELSASVSTCTTECMKNSYQAEANEYRSMSTSTAKTVRTPTRTLTPEKTFRIVNYEEPSLSTSTEEASRCAPTIVYVGQLRHVQALRGRP